MKPALKIFTGLVLFFFFFSFSLSGSLAAEPAGKTGIRLESLNTPQDAASAPPHRPEVSPFEAYAHGKDFRITQFGYDLFNAPPSTFAPADNIPVGPDYLLGPGDELKITLWGRFNVDYPVYLDREGKITLPAVGVLHLSGLTFSEAKAFLEKEFSRYYNPNEVKMNVSMGALRTIRVFVVGKAKRPGSYTLSSLSTLINALFASGGPDKTGSMRDIQVRRGNKTVVHFDLYDFLLKGDKSKDVRLSPEDVIFIPPSGPLAGIDGLVRTPGIYELKNEVSVKDLLDLAGGVNELAFNGRLQVERIADNAKAVVFEARPRGLNLADVRLQPGDMVRVFPVTQDRMVVRLQGAVHRAGEYGISNESMSVKDLLDMAGGLTYNAYQESAELTRVNPTPKGPQTVKININLAKAVSGDPEHNLPLQRDDYLFVRPVPEWVLYRTVTISGEVRFPGVYTVLKGETLSSLIERAGGYTEKAYLKGAVFTRKSVRETQQRDLNEAVDRLEKEFLSQAVAMQQESLGAEDAKQKQAVVAQQKQLIARMRSAEAKGRISIKLTGMDKFKGSYSDLVIEDRDALYIPERPAQVQVIGSVYNQTSFIYDPGNTVKDYIKKAGWMTKNADEDGIFVLKADGTAYSKNQSSTFGLRWDRDENKWVGGGFMSQNLDPGDTVVVPEDMERVSYMKEVKDFTQILYQIAVTAGVLIVAF